MEMLLTGEPISADRALDLHLVNRVVPADSLLDEALEHLVRGIVDSPDDVRVDLRTQRRGEVLEVRVDPSDLGRVIGRQGRTATALRTVLESLAGHPVRVDVVDTDRRR